VSKGSIKGDQGGGTGQKEKALDGVEMEQEEGGANAEETM